MTSDTCSSQPWLLCQRRTELAWNEPNPASCHRTRPPPARRRRASSNTLGQHESGSCTLSFVSGVLPAILWILLFLCRGVNANEAYGASTVFPTQLLFDRSEPPPLPRMLLEARQEQESSSTSALPSTTTLTDGSTRSGTATTSGSIETATETTAVTLPRPFDSSLGNNFTSTTCPTFFQNFLNNQTFEECLPFSLLLQTSNSFFTASRSLVSLTQILDATCNVDFNTCSTVMAQLAQDIKQNANCGADYEMENPMVEQAYSGFLAYPTLYHAGCLTDMDGDYCFANAATNASAPTSSYIYYLPLGVQLPGGTQPACTQCLQNTMAIFAETATNSSQPLSQDYVNAAQQIEMTCGPTFVDSTVRTSAAALTMSSSPPYALATLFSLATLIMNSFAFV